MKYYSPKMASRRLKVSWPSRQGYLYFLGDFGTKK